ncbi:hypothetical protein DL96DRAFT_1625164 [Flagelloscypha sp. PMI_526]|nr:hypothetical protein DL96DRAFT_1625164 [Flagelloscypha sp. PMI_526]
MAALKAGTLRESDLESLKQSSPAKKRWIPKKLKPTFWITLFTASCCGYNVVACTIGRFLLDHFRLWKWTIPFDTPSIEKHVELIAAFVAGCLATPATFGLLFILISVDDQLKKREVKYQFSDHGYHLIWPPIFVNLVLVIVAGAMFHPQFRYAGAVSILAVYGFGCLLIPAVGIFVGVVWGSLHLWDKWRKK